MALVTLKEILEDADRRGYAVGSFNMVSFGFLNGILEAAEEERSPVILSVAEVHLPHMDIEQFAPVAVESAKKASVPVAFHLDHGLHFEIIIKAIKWGFTSVMYDGSSLDYEENVKNTELLSRIVKAAGLSIEAELGRVGGEEGSEGANVNEEFFTDPELAEIFVDRTNIDALAVAVGNAHGFYKRKPKLDFERIKKIKERCGIPLVLHGGSGLSDEDFIRAIRMGISKVNFFTGMTYAAVQRIKEFIKTDPKGYEWIALEAKNAIKDVVREKMRIFGSSGRG